MQQVEWGEFRVGDLFEVLTTKKKFNATDVEFGGKYRYVARGESNNGIRGYITEDHQYLNEANTISFGQDTATMFYQSEPYFTGDKIKVFHPKKHIQFNRKIAQIFISALKKAFSSFSWGSSSYNVSVLNSIKMQLPIKNGNIDFDFMVSFIAQLEAERIAELEEERIVQIETYLAVTGLKDYTLSEEEKRVLEAFKEDKIEFNEVTYESIFNKIVQGRRLKKEDQITGNIPFVMAGTTNTGVVNYIANPVASFPKNSITVDIFGNTFYRDYAFGAGDDTGVYWNDEKNYSKETMLFLATSMRKSILGKFSFEKKLRSSQSLNFKMMLPTQNQQPDYAIMETFISAIQKLVIKDVVLYADQKIAATKSVVNK